MIGFISKGSKHKKVDPEVNTIVRWDTRTHVGIYTESQQIGNRGKVTKIVDIKLLLIIQQKNKRIQWRFQLRGDGTTLQNVFEPTIDKSNIHK